MTTKSFQSVAQKAIALKLFQISKLRLCCFPETQTDQSGPCQCSQEVQQDDPSVSEDQDKMAMVGASTAMKLRARTRREGYNEDKSDKSIALEFTGLDRD